MNARRRFYTAVTVTDDLGVALDGRPVKTPLKQKLVLPTRPLAEAVAEEWAGQGDTIEPHGMVLTKLANTAIDRVAPERPRLMSEVRDYANSDLVCYRAEQPAALAARHAAHWDPVVDWVRTALDAPFAVTSGVVHRPQPEAALKAHESAIQSLSHYEFAAFHSLMTLTGSALIATLLARAALSPEAAWAAAHVDEDFQIEQWGEDEEAAARRAARHAEFLACYRFLSLCR